MYFRSSITVLSPNRNVVSNQWQPDLLFNSLFRLAAKKISKLHIIGPLWAPSISDWSIPLTKGQQCGKGFHAIMSSCITSVSSKQRPISSWLWWCSFNTTFLQHRLFSPSNTTAITYVITCDVTIDCPVWIAVTWSATFRGVHINGGVNECSQDARVARAPLSVALWGACANVWILTDVTRGAMAIAITPWKIMNIINKSIY